MPDTACVDTRTTNRPLACGSTYHGEAGRLLSIGAFSTATGLSQKALRLYDRHGLLRPAYTDPDSGYRYYRTDQLTVAKLIRLMRQMEIPLTKIRRLLTATPTEAGNMLITYWCEAEERMARQRRVKNELIGCLHEIQRKETNAMSAASEMTTATETIPTQLVLSISKRIKVEGLEGHMTESVARLNTFAQEAGAEIVGEPFGIYHGPVNHDDDGPMEVCLPVRGAFAPSGDIVARELLGGDAVRVIGTGDYCEFPKVLELYDAAVMWMKQNGHEPAESPRELWTGPNGEGNTMQVLWRYR
jgi:DNA-binding transcriptional MerR regulator